LTFIEIILKAGKVAKHAYYSLALPINSVSLVGSTT